jgi:hypothetical protein
MNEYTVLQAFERHSIGDTVSLNARQAKYLLLNGCIEAKAKEPSPEPVKKIKEAN